MYNIIFYCISLRIGPTTTACQTPAPAGDRAASAVPRHRPPRTSRSKRTIGYFAPRSTSVDTAPKMGGWAGRLARHPPRPPVIHGGSTARGGASEQRIPVPWRRGRHVGSTDPVEESPEAGGGGTSQWKTIGSTCSPALGGRQDRVRGDARARLVDELEASVGQTASGPPPTSESESTRTEALFIIPGAASTA